MKIRRLKWASSRGPFGTHKVREFPLIGVNWRGYVIVGGKRRKV